MLIREGVTKGNPLLIFIYDITLALLEEELKASDTGLLILCGRSGILWVREAERKAPKYAPGEGFGLRILPQVSNIAIYS